MGYFAEATPLYEYEVDVSGWFFGDVDPSASIEKIQADAAIWMAHEIFKTMKIDIGSHGESFGNVILWTDVSDNGFFSFDLLKAVSQSSKTYKDNSSNKDEVIASLNLLKDKMQELADTIQDEIYALQ